MKLTLHKVAIFLIMSSLAFPQDDFNDEVSEEARISVSGIVIDAANSKPIGGANITLGDTGEGAASDGDGSFAFENIISKCVSWHLSLDGRQPIKSTYSDASLNNSIFSFVSKPSNNCVPICNSILFVFQ